MNKYNKDLRLHDTITEEEKQEILQYEALVAKLTKSWQEVERKTLEAMEEVRQYGCNGHPSQED